VAGAAGGRGEPLFQNRTACHSTASIEQQWLDRRIGNDIMAWMKDEMSWPVPSQEAYDQIVDDHVAHFGQDAPR
jgi:hypothetical protein